MKGITTFLFDYILKDELKSFRIWFDYHHDL